VGRQPRKKGAANTRAALKSIRAARADGAPRESPDPRKDEGRSQPKLRGAVMPGVKIRVCTRTGLLLGCGLATAGAALTPMVVAADAPAAPRDSYVETTLLFGTERPDGAAAVTESEFQRFLDTEVTPRFPDGLTVDQARGQYRDRHGVIEKERSYQVIVLYPSDRASSTDAKLERIRRLYTESFRQESVGRVDEAVHASFE
jgi:uncharacterized protein DUF3574